MAKLRKTKKDPIKAQKNWHAKNMSLAVQSQSVRGDRVTEDYYPEASQPLANQVFSQAVRFTGPMRGLRMA